MDALPEGFDGDLGREGQGYRANITGRAKAVLRSAMLRRPLRVDFSVLARLRVRPE